MINAIAKRLEDCIDMHCIGGFVVRDGMKSDLKYLLDQLKEARERVNVWRKRAHNPPGGLTAIYPDVLESWEQDEIETPKQED